jgi:predicted nuclease with RNAse H fold
MLALGVDVSLSRGLDFVLLDENRRLVGQSLRRRTPDDLPCVLAEQKPGIVAIDSPPKLGTNGGSRLAEREPLRLGIHAYCTPSDPEKAKRVLRLDARRLFSLRGSATHRLSTLHRQGAAPRLRD